jgi:NAD-dependent deacetylase
MSCDLLLVVGTRAEVRPAADLITMAKSVQAQVIVVNPGEHVAGDLADLTLSGAAGEVLPVLLKDIP